MSLLVLPSIVATPVPHCSTVRAGSSSLVLPVGHVSVPLMNILPVTFFELPSPYTHEMILRDLE